MIIEPSYAEQNLIEAEKYADKKIFNTLAEAQVAVEAFIAGRISSSGDLENFIPKYNALVKEVAELKEELAKYKQGLGL